MLFVCIFLDNNPTLNSLWPLDREYSPKKVFISAIMCEFFGLWPEKDIFWSNFQTVLQDLGEWFFLKISALICECVLQHWKKFQLFSFLKWRLLILLKICVKMWRWAQIETKITVENITNKSAFAYFLYLGWSENAF